ncbi:hypothetical protein MN116_008846 [Schistosoma mekongi]|uniref:Uncharacterized protein n=1 Tax=Schistosoma mekongi TaxID=38744 RepID=A0AAE2D166_SCHME|nr:hypothetical protein MN116_008846 [Schistosoma mekongi]
MLSSYTGLISKYFGEWELIPSTSPNHEFQNIDNKDLTDLYLPMISSLGYSPLFSLKIDRQTRSIHQQRNFYDTAFKLGILELEKTKVDDAFEMMKHLSRINVPESSQPEELKIPITLDELNSICPQIRWSYLFKEILTEAEYDDHEGLPITIVGKMQLRNHCKQNQLSLESHRRTFQTMVIINFVAEQMAYVLPPTTGGTTHPSNPSSETRFDVCCIARLQETFTWTLERYYLHSHVNETHKNMLTAMFEEVKKTLLKSISEITWLSVHEKSYLSNKIMEVKLHALYSDLIDSGEKEKISMLYRYPMKVDDYYLNEFYIHKAQRLDSLRSGLFTFNVSLSSQQTFVTSAIYDYRKDILYINAGMMQFPFYSDEDDMPSRFGSTGFMLAHELMHVIDIKGVVYNKRENYQGQEFYENLSYAISVKAECFRDQHLAYGYTSDKIKHYTTVNEMISDNAGLKASYNTYRRLLEEHADHVSQDVRSDLAYDRSFFLRFAQSLCGHRHAEVVDEYLKKSPYVLERDRVNGAVSNSKEFSVAFGCPDGSLMNPQIKCSVW